MKKTSLELELNEAKQTLDSLNQAYSSDSWNDSVKESYKKLLEQQKSYLDSLMEYKDFLRDAVSFDDVDKLVDLAKNVCRGS